MITCQLWPCSAESGSPAFDEFLELMGQKVRMKGFSKYRAQLDNKSKLASTAALKVHVSMVTSIIGTFITTQDTYCISGNFHYSLLIVCQALFSP